MTFKDYVLNENMLPSFVLNCQKLDNETFSSFQDIQNDNMLLTGDIPIDSDISSLIYRHSRPELKITITGLDPSEDGNEYFYTINSVDILKRIQPYFIGLPISNLISPGNVESGVFLNSDEDVNQKYISPIRVFLYKKGTINTLINFLKKIKA